MMLMSLTEHVTFVGDDDRYMISTCPDTSDGRALDT